MPYCTNCGKREPRRRALLLPVRHRWPLSGAARAPGDSTATISIGRRRRARRSPPTASSTRSTPRRSTRCPSGSALLVVQRGPGAGSRFLLDKDVVTAGRHPDSEIFLDDVTVSRRHATFTREGDDVHRRRRRQPQRHLRQPRPHRHACVLKDTDEVQIGKYRLVFFQGHESAVSDDRHVGVVGAARGLGPGPAQHRGGPRPAAPRLPGHHDPQDPLPRGQGAGQARAHAGRLPQVLRRRHRPAALRAAHAARPLPAAAGDRRAPRRHRPRPRAAADRAGGARPCPTVALAADGLPSRRVVRPPRPRCGSRARSCSRSPRSPRSCSASSSSSAWSRRAPAPATTTPTRWSIATTARELAEFGFEPRHLRAFKTAADREVGLVEQVVAPHKRGRDTAAQARAEETVSEIAALSVRLHATLVKAGLRAT